MNDVPSPTHVTDPAEEAKIQSLAEHGGDLKRELVAFAQARRFDRYREQELRKAAGEDGAPPEPGSDRWIRAMDDFIMAFRFPDGTGVIERYLSAAGRQLRAADRKLLKGWLDPVYEIFEIREAGSGSLLLHGLIDELDYRTYSSMGLRDLPIGTGDFVITRLVSLMPGAWSVSGAMTPLLREHAKTVAELAMDWATRQPQLAFRNPAKREKGWELMRKDRDDFIAHFGADQVVMRADEALERVNAYYEDRQRRALSGRGKDYQIPDDLPGTEGHPAVTLPEGALDGVRTVGVIFDATDGLSFLPEFGRLEELFADPSLAVDSHYARALIGFLDSDSIYPGPLRRLAAAYPDTVDEVYRTVLKKPTFTWEKHGERLLKKRKSWYFAREPLPSTTPISRYLEELLEGNGGTNPPA